MRKYLFRSSAIVSIIWHTILNNIHFSIMESERVDIEPSKNSLFQCCARKIDILNNWIISIYCIRLNNAILFRGRPVAVTINEQKSKQNIIYMYIFQLHSGAPGASSGKPQTTVLDFAPSSTTRVGTWFIESGGVPMASRGGRRREWLPSVNGSSGAVKRVTICYETQNK